MLTSKNVNNDVTMNLPVPNFISSVSFYDTHVK